MLMLVCGIYVCGALHEFGHIIVARHFSLPVVGLRVSGMGGFCTGRWRCRNPASS